MTDRTVPSRQEMFDRAWRGLRGQGFVRSASRDGTGVCLYVSQTGARCAWGWADPSLRAEDNHRGSVVDLHYGTTRGVAPSLSEDDVDWATELQRCHDNGITPSLMESNLRAFALRFNLVIPDEVTS